jgi:hypothetical protein
MHDEQQTLPQPANYRKQKKQNIRYSTSRQTSLGPNLSAFEATAAKRSIAIDKKKTEPSI